MQFTKRCDGFCDCGERGQPLCSCRRSARPDALLRPSQRTFEDLLIKDITELGRGEMPHEFLHKIEKFERQHEQFDRMERIDRLEMDDMDEEKDLEIHSSGSSDRERSSPLINIIDIHRGIRQKYISRGPRRGMDRDEPFWGRARMIRDQGLFGAELIRPSFMRESASQPDEASVNVDAFYEMADEKSIETSSSINNLELNNSAIGNLAFDVMRSASRQFVFKESELVRQLLADLKQRGTKANLLGLLLDVANNESDRAFTEFPFGEQPEIKRSAVLKENNDFSVNFNQLMKENSEQQFDTQLGTFINKPFRSEKFETRSPQLDPYGVGA